MSSATSPQTPATNDRRFFAFNGVLSAAALGFLFYILYGRPSGTGLDADLRFLPAVNAGLNALTSALLVAGFVAIRRGARVVHRYFMVSALASSALFLACYVAYHYVHGDTKYAGTGLLKTLYLTILASHVLLSMAVLPLALSAVYFALRQRHSSHRRVARIALPVWLYVSVTGVAIFFMLRAA